MRERKISFRVRRGEGGEREREKSLRGVVGSPRVRSKTSTGVLRGFLWITRWKSTAMMVS